MSTFRQEPYLWLHIAGLTVIPLWGLGIWLGIAAGEPIASYRLEETVLVLVGVAPWLWMQWRRPFNPFSLLAVSLPPNVLTADQRRWLTLLKSRKTQIFALFAVLPMIWLLGECYKFAPLATGATPIPNHVLGFGVAAIAFLGANLFMQVSLSMVGLLLLTSETRFTATTPYEVTAINADFFRFGLQMRQILPPVAAPTTRPGLETVAVPESESVITDTVVLDSIEPTESTEAIAPELASEAQDIEVIEETIADAPQTAEESADSIVVLDAEVSDGDGEAIEIVSEADIDIVKDVSGGANA